MSPKDCAWVDGVEVDLPDTPLEPIHHHANGWVHWMTVEVNGRPRQLSVVRRGDSYHVVLDGRSYAVKWGRPTFDAKETTAEESGDVFAPMSCRVVQVLAKVGDWVKSGQPLLRVESMKLESTLRAPRDGMLVELASELDATLKEGQRAARVEPAAPVTSP